MGLLGDITGALGDAADDIGNFASDTWNALFPGASGNGAHANDIYGYFYHGAGTPSYHAAANTLGPVVTSMQGYQDHLNKAQQALAAGWQSDVADQAQQSFTPLTQNAQQLATHADGLHTQITAQADSFDTTKPKVVQVPKNAPSGPGLLDYAALTSPATLAFGASDIASADSSISQYNSNVQANQNAYTGYQGPTNGQTNGLPQNGNLSPSTGPGTPTPGPVGVGPVGVGFGSHGPRGTTTRNTTRNPVTRNTNPTQPIDPYVPHPYHPPQPIGNPWTPVNNTTNLSNYQGPGGPNPLGNPNMPGGGGGSNPYGGGGFNGPGAGGAGFAAGGLGAGAAGAGGRSGVGGFGSGEDEIAAGRAAAAGARGASGAGGSGAGRGGKREEDAEHKTAEYLQEDDPDAIFGTDQKTVPPVIGL